MTLATLTQVKKRVIQILNANRLSYTSSVGTGAAALGAYPFDQEVTDAAIEADGLVIVEGYFQSKLALRNRFFLASANLTDGDKLPECDGLIGKVQWSVDGNTAWKDSKPATSNADIDGANESGSYVGATSFRGRHFIDEESGYFFSTSPFSRIYIPTYIRTDALQALQIHVSAIIAASIMLLYKNNAQAAFDWYKELFYMSVGRIKNGSLELPEVGPVPNDMRGGNG